MTSIAANIIGLLISFGVFLVVFLILRALWLWYFRINDICYMLEWQKNLLEKQSGQNKRVIELLEKIAGEKTAGESAKAEDAKSPSGA